MDGVVACGGEEKCTQGSGGENKGRRPFGRPGRRWENIVKMDLEEIGWRRLAWLDLAQHRDVRRVIVNAVLKIGFRKMRGLLSRLETISFSRSTLLHGV